MSGERILVVDDSKEVRDFLARTVLPLEGYVVEVASDGREALNAALSSPPDLIITDQAMPRMSGLELVERLQRAGANIPVILMTAEGSEDISVQALRARVADYFTKPLDTTQLLASIRNVLAESQTRKAETGPPDPLQGLSTLDASQLAAILRQIQNPMLVVDTQGRVVLFNLAAQAFLTRIKPGEPAIGRLLFEVTDNPSLLGIFDYADGRLIASREVELDDGRIFNAHISDIAGTGRAVVMQDITHLKDLDRIRADLVTTISHDVRSPLTAILSYVELMRRMGELNAQQHLFADQIKESVQRITELIGELLEHNKLEIGLDQQCEPVLLWQVTRRAAETLAGRADVKNQRLLLDFREDDLRVWGNPLRLQHVVSNLIDNAIKYTPVGGEVTVRIRQEAGQAICTVSDTGIGIPLEDQPHIFDKFYRVTQEAGSHEGTGVGLSIVKSIVEAHDGRVWVESQPDKGTTFTVMLPVYGEKTAPQPQRVAAR